MLAFAPLSATPLSALPIAGSTYAVESLGVVSKFGTPTAIWDQFCDVSGFSPVQFGTQTHRRTQPVSGFAPVQFGTPAGYKLQRVQGFAPVQFGTQLLYPMHVAPWPVSTQFGTPSARQYWNVPSLGVITKFGTPTTPTNRTCNVSGFAPVQFGTPVVVRHRPPNMSIICMAEGFKPVHFGTPAAHWDKSGQVQAIAPTVQFGAPRAITAHHVDGLAPIMRFGTPTIRMTLKVSGLKSTSFGSAKAILTQHGTGSAPIIHVGLAKAITTHHVGSVAPTTNLGAPMARTLHRVSGFKSVAFGWPGAVLTQRASGASPKVRFGTHKTVRPDWYEVRGFCPFRAGTPHGYQRNNRRADGFSPVQFGMAAAFHAHRTTSVPPVARLGKPLLKRNTQC